MPELPDVEHWRRYASRHATGQQVQGVTVRDAGVLRNTSAQGLGRALKGTTLPDPVRQGKWLIFPVEPSPLVLHFGMTGGLGFTSGGDGFDTEDRVVFHLDGGDLTYRSVRKLGGVWLAVDGVEEVTGPLGPDALDAGPDGILERLDGRRGGVKATLMDQAVVAGIGNELSDEILWRARVDPRRKLTDLDASEREHLAETAGEVLVESARHGRIPSEKGWLEEQRGEDDATCPHCGSELASGKVAGRTAWWCPDCQQ